MNDQIEEHEKKTDYKKTKLGTIPEEWKIDDLKNLCMLITDGAHASPPTVNNGYPIGTVENMLKNKIDIPNCRRIDLKDFNYLVKNNCSPQVGDVLLSKDGTIGQTFVYNQDDKIILLSSIAIIRPNLNKLNPYYCSFFFQSPLFYGEIKRNQTGSALKRIILKDIKKLKLPTPSLSEQSKIAAILTTWDNAIEQTENIIEVKQKLKKGLMQQLLTGKKRFKEFEDEEWEDHKLGGICEIKGRIGWRGYKVEDLRENGPLVIGAKHISEDNKLDLSEPVYISKEKYLESPEIMIGYGDLLLVQRGSLGKVVLIDRNLDEATINPSLVILKSKNIETIFLYYYLCSNKLQRIIKSETGSTGVPMISQNQIKSFIIPLPSFQEQQKIAKVLSNADDKLKLLKNQLQLQKQQKKGLMQKLLTGKIRVNT